MPINIYNRETDSKIAWLCDDSWSIVEQFEALEAWLYEAGRDLPRSDYVADLAIRARTDYENSVGGGAAFSPKAIAIMAEIGMHLFLSEYPG